MMQTKYRKKPVVIEAMQTPLNSEKLLMLADWLGTHEIEVRDTGIVIPTLEGEMTAGKGDWIIKGVAGEVYPCKSEIFAATYDREASDLERFATGAKQQLDVGIRDGVLTMSIGVGLLAFAVQNGPQWPEEFQVTDIREFAREMVRQLRKESEDGTTAVHRMLDAAADEVLEQGGDGVDEGDVEEGIALAKALLDDKTGAA